MGKVGMDNRDGGEGVETLKVMLEHMIMGINGGEVEARMRREGRDAESLGWRWLARPVMGIVGELVVAIFWGGEVHRGRVHGDME